MNVFEIIKFGSNVLKEKKIKKDQIIEEAKLDLETGRRG